MAHLAWARLGVYNNIVIDRGGSPGGAFGMG